MAEVGDRIEVLSLDDPYSKLGPGSRGTITGVTKVDFGGGDKFTQYSVKWDSKLGGSLMLCCPPDRFMVINDL